MTISKENQTNLYKLLKREWERIGGDNDIGMDILNRAWDLRSMPSQDSRFYNAYEDIVQHYYRNDDLTTDELLLDRLNLYQDDQRFIRFIESILFPEYYESEEQILTTTIPVNALLSRDNLCLVTVEYDERGLPFQNIQRKSETNDMPIGIKKNTIPFYLRPEGGFHSKTGNYFLLDPTKNWNDYSYVTIFTLSYWDNNIKEQYIGRVKILYKDELETWRYMENQFIQLDTDFCSLAGDFSYYENLRKLFHERGMISILYALQDAAFFHDIADRFSHNTGFKHSLLRNNNHEKMLRDLKPLLKGLDLTEQHQFKYRFKPAYAQEPIDVDINFNNAEPVPSRIIAIIGKNGTGKTQLMTAIPKSLSTDMSADFYDKAPSFTRVIAVSYSVFDTFNLPQSTATFNYVYCGLKDQEGDLRSTKGLTISFHNNWKKIDDMRRVKRWREILRNFIEREILDSFILKSEDSSRDYEVSLQGFNAVKNRLSSGQSILLFIITQVVANIRVDSLILYDEPETHLHPNAIVELVNTIYDLVNEFESYCLIATHSPLVIREINSRNVFVMERDGNMPSLRRIGIESFGENLGVLSDEVFGDRQMPKQYKMIIDKLIRLGQNFEEIVRTLQYDDVPLSLNARLYIANELKKRNEKL